MDASHRDVGGRARGWGGAGRRRVARRGARRDAAQAALCARAGASGRRRPCTRLELRQGTPAPRTTATGTRVAPRSTHPDTSPAAAGPRSYGGLDRPWVPDVVGRAWGNRGNARARQGKLEAALSDYNTSIALCPWSVDPLLNRGVALEAMGRFAGGWPPPRPPGGVGRSLLGARVPARCAPARGLARARGPGRGCWEQDGRAACAHGRTRLHALCLPRADAAADYRAVLAAAPEDPSAWNNLGNAL